MKEKPIGNFDDTGSEKNNQEEKKVNNLIKEMDINQWRMVQKRLEEDQDFTNFLVNKRKRGKELAFEEHKRLVMHRHENILRDMRKQEESM